MAPQGKYFYIKSKLNDLVLDVSGNSRDPGAKVITWTQKPSGEADNQLWYEDHLTGTIRSKMTGLCLDINDGKNELVMSKPQKGQGSQQWLTSGDRVQSREDPNRVLDIAANNTKPGARVCAWTAHGAANQQWTFEYQSPRYFYIESQMHGKVIDIKKRNADPGVKAIMMDKDESVLDNQLWYEDKHGVVCSKLNNFVLDCSEDNKIRMQPFDSGNPNQLWTVCGEKICNRSCPENVLDIKAKQTKNGAKLLSYAWHGNDNQKWKIQYL